MIERPDTTLVTSLHPSGNFDQRSLGVPPRILLLHYTGMNDCARAIDWLSRPESKVSCHYVIDLDGTITQMVRESDRAWHAGKSYWAGITDVNSASIGIEIHNQGHDKGYPDFPAPQMRAVIALACDICQRNAIGPAGCLAHADVAPTRKDDPGEKFDWQALADHGVGLTLSADEIKQVQCSGAIQKTRAQDAVTWAQSMLIAIGYGVARTGSCDALTQSVVRAFQRHYRPSLVNGQLDEGTLWSLQALVEKLRSVDPVFLPK